MKKILISFSVIAVVAAIAIGATTAFFSDTETSTGNTFTAGAIDLKIDNTSYVTNNAGVLVASPETSWKLDDLGKAGTKPHLFFDFDDLKPGDIGEDTISLHVNDNDAWACMNIAITGTPENDVTEPEGEVDNSHGTNEGELQNELYFAFWADDGDNVYEEGETIFKEGLAGDLFDGSNWALADASRNVWNSQGPIAIDGETDYYIGKVWCYGNLTENPANEGSDNPVDRQTTGFDCDGSPVSNVSQTDGIIADVSFYAVQSRNNEEFLCSQSQESLVEQRHISLENKDADWNIVADDLIFGDIGYSHNDTTFHGVVTGEGLIPGGKYQITLNGPNAGSEMGCSFTNTSLGNFGANTFQSGFWNSAYPNLSSTCTGEDEEGLYNMTLIGDHYTFIADASGNFTYNFDYNLPAGNYSGVKVLVKKMLDTHVSPWADASAVHGTNLYETASISFTIL